MPFVYPDAAKLEGHKKVGSGQCAVLVQYYVDGIGLTDTWREGAKVVGNNDIKAGTAVATFVNKRYPGLDHGNHVAFYLSQDKDGVWVMDQWSSKASISKRYMRRKGTDPKSRGQRYIDPSNNGDALSIIEH